MAVAKKSTRLNPNLFSGSVDSLIDKIFLYSERNPKTDDVIKHNSKLYDMYENFEINLVGSIANAKRSIRGIISACYNKEKFLLDDYDGVLFVYNGFHHQDEGMLSSEAPVMLKFLVYLLKEKNE